ncbi:LXG domain-containing protein [Lentibacillus sp. Marseille-P4043]|uniref:LXG domain-containing protein n=1 Tax=Lentibacillus sp. Marseille-P4043 TaxID=2040293 RepID=UPI00131A4C1C|nr:LXG domain-containing protein [Lentibacillus sp. Marseille-P4043]
MKVLEVSSLEAGIDNAVQDIDTFYDQISGMQRGVRDFYGLEEALKGKGGEAIRSYFNEVHQPFLIFLYQSMVDFQNTLTEMKDSVKTFESNEDGFVKQQFLEQDVEDGFNKVKKKTIALTDDANNIIDSVRDLVAIEHIDDTEVLDNVQDGKKKAEKVVEELTILDNYETSQLKQTKEDLQTMKKYITEIQAKFKGGDLSVADFSMEAVKGIGVYKAVMDSIYGEGYMESLEFKPLFEKLRNGGSLTPAEKNKLYDYFQNVYLDSEKRNEIKSIADSISENGIDKLKERLNEKIVISKNALDEEMAMIQAYVYMGDKRTEQLNVDRGIKAKLEAYLILLENYYSALGKETVARVDMLEYEKDPNNVSGHFLKTALQTAEYNSGSNNVLREEEFRK